MKLRILFPIGISIIIGSICGKLMFNIYNKEMTDVFKSSEKLLFLQSGVYSSKESMETECRRLNSYIYTKDDKYYRVFIGITKQSALVNKLKEYYGDTANDIYVKEIEVNNPAFNEILDQYDQLLANTDDKETIWTIIKQVLSKYEELVINEN